LNDIVVENDFFWEATGQKLGPFMSWGAGEPTSEPAFNCVSLNPSDRVWTVEPCAYPWMYICETKDVACNC